MTLNQKQIITPVQPGQRILTLDILRGFAIFGILLVNMQFFNHSALTYVMGLGKPTGTLDQLARWFIAFFAEGKFYSTFAFLFGLGMAIQYSRAQEKGVRFVPFYLRRLFVLFIIGLMHAYLFWVGDILILYSVLGVVLLLFFRNRQPRTLLIWTIIFLIVPLLLNGALFALTELAKMSPGGEEMMTEILAEQARRFQSVGAQADQVYATGTFAEITRQRVRDMNFMYMTWPFMAFNVLAMFVLGLYAGQRRIFDVTPDNRSLIRQVLIWGLIVGVIGNLLYVVAGESANRSIPSPQLLVSLAGQTFGAPALSLFYMAGLAFLAENPVWQRRLTPLVYVGRMAITNYLLQTVICTTLFYGYGFGFYGRIGLAAGILLTLVIYLLQIPFSVWWLNRFRFGPLEWLWRSLTYGQRQSMRIRNSSFGFTSKGT
jgi:uncharacterized protein